MPKVHGYTSADKGGIEVGRKGVAWLLFAVARPTDAKASPLDGDALRLTLPMGSRDIGVGEIDAVELQTGWRWGRVKPRTCTRPRCRIVLADASAGST